MGAFAVSAADAPGLMRAENRREDDEFRQHVHRRCAFERQPKRAPDLQGRARDPGPTGPLRVAHDQAGTGPFFGKLSKNAHG